MGGKRSGKLRSYEEIILVLVANPLVLSQLLRNKATQEKAVNVKDLNLQQLIMNDKSLQYWSCSGVGNQWNGQLLVDEL